MTTKSCLLLLIFLFGFQNFKCQDNELKIRSKKSPVILINNVVSSSKNFGLKTDQIESLQIFKNAKLPENFQSISNLSKYGLIEVLLKTAMSGVGITNFAELNINNNFEPNHIIYLNGLLVENPQLRIFNKAILRTQILSSNDQKFLNIVTEEI